MNLDRLAALAAAIEPTDWTYESDQVWGNDGDLVADVSGVWRNSEWTTDDVVAEYIARACLAAPRLVAALRAVEAAPREAPPEEVLSSPEAAWVQGYNAAFTDIRAAIRAALEAR